jgi:hexosaminidase
MLDVSRHFFTVEEVKAFIDQMARYKYNVFHWHLTDDEGWRIEIKSLPKLTEVGAWRVERHGRFGDGRPYPEPGEKATYGGFYTHDQIRDVVHYAAKRNITIVPEIDFPGHSMAALAAYPELSTRKEPKFVNPGSTFAEWYGNGTFKMLIENTLNPADEKVYEFVDKVFTEVASLFPGTFIHMGGDECYHGYWEEDPEVQKFMKKQGLKDSHELQSYFVKRVEQIISSKGKRMIGWDEIMEGGLAEGAAVMSWRGMEHGIEAARMGHDVVMTPTGYCYLDYTQGDHSVENPIYADLSLERTYSFEPLPEGVDARHILGGQGNLWTEVIPNLPFAFYMTYPRAFALSEVFWSPKEHRDWSDFMARTEAHFERYEAEQINVSRAVFDPIIKVSKEGENLICELKNSVPGTQIFYSVDNTYPARFGTQYSGPFEVPQGNLSLRAQTYRDGKPLGRELIIDRAVLERRAR